MSGSIRLETRGKPTVYIVADHFKQDAVSSAADNGMPGLRMITVPVDEYYRLRITREEVKPVAIGAFDSLVEALTLPLTLNEVSATPDRAETVECDPHNGRGVR